MQAKLPSGVISVYGRIKHKIMIVTKAGVFSVAFSAPLRGTEESTLTDESYSEFILKAKVEGT